MNLDCELREPAAVLAENSQAAVLELLNAAQRLLQAKHSPDGYNIGVNVGNAAGQSRMRVFGACYFSRSPTPACRAQYCQARCVSGDCGL
jgi:hypothetical protein